MAISPLNLISTPLPILNSLGLRLRVGLSSEDPMVTRHLSEQYDVFLTTYSPEGVQIERSRIGTIAPERRKFFEISELINTLVKDQDHLAVIHRVPSRLVSPDKNIEDELEIPDGYDYSLFRSLVEYSYPGGGNGSVIYETPPEFNSGRTGQKSSNSLTFTCQTILSDYLDSHLIIINHSINHSYRNIAEYTFALHSLSGERVFVDKTTIGPFGIRVLNLRNLLPNKVIENAKDPKDGLSSFTFMGYSDNAALLFMVVNTAPSLKSVAVEHTHPPQTYLLPGDMEKQRSVKVTAINKWKAILSSKGAY